MECELPNVGYYMKGGKLCNDICIRGERLLCELLSDEIITDK